MSVNLIVQLEELVEARHEQQVQHEHLEYLCFELNWARSRWLGGEGDEAVAQQRPCPVADAVGPAVQAITALKETLASRMDAVRRRIASIEDALAALTQRYLQEVHGLSIGQQAACRRTGTQLYIDSARVAVRSPVEGLVIEITGRPLLKNKRPGKSSIVLRHPLNTCAQQEWQ